MLRSISAPWSPLHFYGAVLAALLCAACCLVLWRPLTRASLALLRWRGRAFCSACVFVLVVALVAGMTGWRGLLVLLTASGIGLVPVLYGARRSNALGVVLLPVACGMSGVAGAVSAGLGLA